MEPMLHVVIQIILLLVNIIPIVVISTGKGYVEKLDREANQKRKDLKK